MSSIIAVVFDIGLWTIFLHHSAPFCCYSICSPSFVNLSLWEIICSNWFSEGFWFIFHEPPKVHPPCSTLSILIRYYYYHYYYHYCYWMVSRWFLPTDMFQFWGMVSTRHLTPEDLFWKFCWYISRQFMRIHTSSTINIEKIWNRPITKFYNGGDVNVIAAELRLTKRSQLLFIRGIIFYKKQCQQM